MISINTLPQSPQSPDLCARCAKSPHPDHTITKTIKQDKTESFAFTYMLCKSCAPIELEKEAGLKLIREDYSQKIQLAAVGIGIAVAVILFLLSVNVVVAFICGIAFATIIWNGLKSYFLLQLPDEGISVVNIQVRPADMSTIGLKNTDDTELTLKDSETVFYTFLNDDYGIQFISQNKQLHAPVKMVITTSLNPSSFAFGQTVAYACTHYPPAIAKDALNLVRKRSMDLNYTAVVRANVRKFRDSMELYSTNESKKCTNCGQTVPITTKVGENCPQCGVIFSAEQVR